MLQKQSFKNSSLPYKDKNSQQSCELRPINEILLTYLKKVEKDKFKKYIPGNIRENIDLILSLTRKNKSVMKVIISSLLAKLKYSNWDTRLHKKNISGLENLDRIDEKYISPVLFKEGYYESSTKFSLTASLNLYEPFTENYKGGISPKECKTSFLFLMKEMNENSKFDYEKVLLYILQKLKKRKDNLQKLQKKTLSIVNIIKMDIVKKILNDIFDTVDNCSVIPVIATHLIYTLKESFKSNNINIIKPLKEHTTCDKNTDSFGDIEGYDKDGNLKIVIEVKHKIKITKNIFNTFDNKTNNNYNIYRCITTTIKNPIKEEDIDGDTENIDIINTTDLIKFNLSNLLEFKKDIYKDYLISFRKAILDYKNLDIKVKEDCEKIFEKYMK
jgi:hypothetical protein